MFYPKQNYTLEEYHQIVEAHPDCDFMYDKGKIWLMTGYTIDHPTHRAVRSTIASSLKRINREKYQEAILNAYDARRYDAMYAMIAERDAYALCVFNNKSARNTYGLDGPEKPLFYIPDILMVPIDPDDLDGRVSDVTFQEAVLLVDIFCEIGERSKKQDKLAAYQSSQRYRDLQEILIVDPHDLSLEHFRRDDANQWERFSYTRKDQVIELTSIQIQLPVRDIYHQVSLT